MTTYLVTIRCRHCESDDTVKFGFAASGQQRYRCRACGRTFIETPGSAAHDAAFRETVLRAYHERPSMRGICRIFRISRNTLVAWLKKSPASALPG